MECEKITFYDADWLLCTGKTRFERIAVIGEYINPGAVFLSRFCTEFILISSSEETLSNMRGIAKEQGIENCVFAHTQDFPAVVKIQPVDYLLLYSPGKNEKSSICLLKELTVDGSIIGCHLKKPGPMYLHKLISLLRELGYGRINIFWVFPGIEHPTWSASAKDAWGLRMLAGILDRYNAQSRGLLLVRKIFFSRPAKAFMKAASISFVPLQLLFMRDYHLIAYRGSVARDEKLSAVIDKPFLKKSKPNKEGRVIFFVKGKHGSTDVVYFSKFREHEDLLENETQRNIFTACPISKGVYDDGRIFVYSRLLLGKRFPLSRNKADLRPIEWLVNFQEETCSGFWNGGEWKRDIVSLTCQTADDIADKFLSFLKKEGRKLRKVAEHGDFDHLNLFLEKNRLCVLDWEYYRKEGDEFFDITYFLFNMYTELNPDFNAFHADYMRQSPYKEYLEFFTRKKGLANTDLFVLATAIMLLRIKYQGVCYGGLKDARFSAFDLYIECLCEKVAKL